MQLARVLANKSCCQPLALFAAFWPEVQVQLQPSQSQEMTATSSCSCCQSSSWPFGWTTFYARMRHSPSQSHSRSRSQSCNAEDVKSVVDCVFIIFSCFSVVSEIEMELELDNVRVQLHNILASLFRPVYPVRFHLGTSSW